MNEGVAQEDDGKRPWEGLALGMVFLLALLLRVGVAVDYERQHPLADRPVIDERSYEEWALAIAAGDWVGDEVFFQEPLYPYWLGAAYSVLGSENRTGVRHLQAFVGALTAVLVHLLARRLFGAWAGLIAGLAMATHRPALLFPSLLLKPNLVLPVIVGLALTMTWTRARESAANGRRVVAPWVLMGALAGVGALLRGNLLLLVPCFVLLPIARALLTRAPLRRAWGSTALVLAGTALVLLPVAARNAAVGGRFVLTTSGAGTNVYGGNNAENPFGRATEFSWVRGIPRYEADDWRHEAERRLGRSLEPDEVSRYWLSETWRSMLDDPALHARIFWNKLRLTLGAYEVPDNHHLEWDARHVDLLRLPWPGFAVWGWLGLAGVIVFVSSASMRNAARSRADAWECAAFLALYVATIVLTVTSMRARLAIVPLLLPFAGALAMAVVTRMPLARWLPGAALAGLIVWWPIYDDDDRRQDLDKRDFNMAVYLFQNGDRDGAEALAEDLDARYPGTSRVLTLRAQLEFERGFALRREHPAGSAEEQEGRELIRTSLKRLQTVCSAPGVPARETHRARLVSARIQATLGNFAAAENHYRAALTFDPDDTDTLVGLASALLAQLDDAEPDAAAERRREAEELLTRLVERGAGPPGLAERLDELRRTAR